MAKKQKQSIIGFLLVTVLVVAAVFGIIKSMAQNAGITTITDYAIIYNKEYYMHDEDGFVFEKGDELEIKFFNDPVEFDVKVYAIENKDGAFSFTTGDNETVHTWNDAIAPRDITQNFTLHVKQATDKENGKIVFMSDVVDVIEAFAGKDVHYTDADYDGDFFQIEITAGEQTIKLEFTVIDKTVDFIKLDKQEIIFNQ